MLGKEMCHLFLIGRFGNGDDVRLHQPSDAGRVVRRDEVRQCDLAQQLALGVEDVGERGCVATGALLCLPAEIAERLGGGHVGAHADVARVHQTARLIFRVGQQGDHLGPRGLVQQRQQPGALIGRRGLNHVRDVVRCEEADPRAALPGLEHEEHLGLVGAAEIKEELVCRVGGKLFEAPGALLGVQERPGFGDLDVGQLFLFGHRVSRGALSGALPGGGGGRRAIERLRADGPRPHRHALDAGRAGRENVEFQPLA